VLYINGNGGLLERMKDTGVDVIGLDWTVDMADGRRRLGNGIGVQGNVDPAFLFSPLPVLTDEIHRSVKVSCFPFMCFCCVQLINEISKTALSEVYVFLSCLLHHHSVDLLATALTCLIFRKCLVVYKWISVSCTQMGIHLTP
jgi:hypothetical protein